MNLSIAFFKILLRNETRLNQTNHDLNEIKEEIKTGYNGSYEEIKELEKKIDQVEKSLKDLIAETNSSLQNKINDVKIDSNTRLITVQDQVSDIQTDVNNMKMNFGSFQDSTNNKFTKVWAKFNEIDKEIANLPKNS